jgi:hypothetical protein
VKFRVRFPHHERQTTSATKIPGEKLETVKKTPLLQPANDSVNEQETITKTSAPASTLFFCPLPFRLPVAAEGR